MGIAVPSWDLLGFSKAGLCGLGPAPEKRKAWQDNLWDRVVSSPNVRDVVSIFFGQSPCKPWWTSNFLLNLHVYWW